MHICSLKEFFPSTAPQCERVTIDTGVIIYNSPPDPDFGVGTTAALMCEEGTVPVFFNTTLRAPSVIVLECVILITGEVRFVFNGSLTFLRCEGGYYIRYISMHVYRHYISS